MVEFALAEPDRTALLPLVATVFSPVNALTLSTSVKSISAEVSAFAPVTEKVLLPAEPFRIPSVNDASVTPVKV